MKTRLSVKNPSKSKPIAPAISRIGQCRNEPPNVDSGERKKKTKDKYLQLMLQSETPEQRARLQKQR